MPSWLIITLTILGSLLLLFLIYFITNGIIFTNVSFRRRKGDKDFARTEDPRAKKDPDRIWYFSNQLEEIDMLSYDKLHLKGYFLNNNSSKLAILIHGYHGRYYSVVHQARIFFENGYDVLSINNRTHDTSEGKVFTMGKREKRDVASWIELMLKRNPNYQIVLYGISMGGHIAMLSASDKNVNEKVKCVIEDCGYYSLKDELLLVLKKGKFPLPHLIINLADLYSRIFYRFSYTYTIGKAFKDLKLPILMFHGADDDYVPTKNIELNYNAVPEGVYKEKHIFEGCGHTRCVVNKKEEYRQIVDEFVNKFVK